MNTQTALERCQALINCQLHPAGKFTGDSASERRAITISRQAGSGAHAVAGQLAEYLQSRRPHGGPWVVFDKNLVEQVLQDHNLPKRLARFMPEDRISEITDIMEELFGLHPPTWILVRQTAQTILRLAQLGNVILIGRGANVVTSKLKNVFHVRLVAPLEKRIACVRKAKGTDRKTALEFIKGEDAGRRRYLKKYFGENIDNSLLYHIVINTGLVDHAEAAKIIGDAVLRTMRNGHAAQIVSLSAAMAERPLRSI